MAMSNNTLGDFGSTDYSGGEEYELPDCHPNMSSNVTLPVYEVPMYTFVTVTFFFVVIFLIGLVGNLLVIFVVCRNREMRNSTNISLLNLSIADMLVILICMPAGAAEFYAQKIWYLGDAMCKIVAFLENTATHASVLVIIAISLDRYYAICHPLKAQYMCTTGRTIKIITVVWLTAIGSCLPFVFISEEIETFFYDCTVIKVCNTDMTAEWTRVYALIILAVFFAVPLSTLIVLYTLISRKLMSDPRMFKRTDSNESASSTQVKQRHQVVVMLMSVITLFFVCLLPMKVFALWELYSTYEDMEQLGFIGYINLSNFARIMVYINSAANPILYNVISSKFRDSFKKALGLGGSGVRRQSTITTYVSLRRKSSTTCQTDVTSVHSPANKSDMSLSLTYGHQCMEPLPGRNGVHYSDYSEKRSVTRILSNGPTNNGKLHTANGKQETACVVRSVSAPEFVLKSILSSKRTTTP